MEQKSEAWYRARAGRITGSRFARAMAGRRSKDYCGLIDELAEERRRGRSVDGGYVNSAMQWGIDHEEPARRWYGRLHGCRVDQVGFVVHPDFDYVGVSPDGLVAHDGLVEIKCPQMKGFRQVIDSQKMPSRYRWQVQGQLWVCQREWTDFVCFYPPEQGVVIRIFKKEGDLDQLETRCREINHEVERRVGPRGMATVAAYGPVPITPTTQSRQAGKPSSPESWTTPNRPVRKSEQSGWPAWVWFLLIIVALAVLRVLSR